MLRPADVARHAPDPADAARRAERLLDAASQSGLDLARLDDAGVRIATLACRSAPYLATLLTRDPRRLVRVAADPYLRREKPGEVVAAELATHTDPATSPAQLRAALRRVRADELVRLGVREFEGLDVDVGRELARLADACFDAAIRYHDRELRARFGSPRFIDDDGRERDAAIAVIGMGKLGGEELNFASDVDVIYIYSSDQGEAGGLSLHEYFAKLCTQITTAMSAVDEDDIVFRVDLRLRPEGAKGAIANSLAQIERYYETFGRPWERQAWIKARPCAGSAQLGSEIMATLRPFVFPRVVAPTVIDEIRDLNRRIKRELVRPRRTMSPAGHATGGPAPDPTGKVGRVPTPPPLVDPTGGPPPDPTGKTGRVLAPRVDPTDGPVPRGKTDRVPTPRLLAPLIDPGPGPAPRPTGKTGRVPTRRLLTPLVDLKNGEGGIREVEFFVQALQLIHAGKRPSVRCRGTLAALDALLFAGLVTDDEHGSLWRAYRWLRHGEHVLQLDGGLQTQTVPEEGDARLVFARRLGYPTEAAFALDLAHHADAVATLFATLGAPDDESVDVAAILRGDLTDDEEADALTRLGFADVTAARAELARARRNPGSPLSPITTERNTRVGAKLLAEIASSADPDQALRHLGDLIARRGEAWSIWRLLDENPAITRLLGSLLGASAYLARTLVDTPEAIDLLVELGQTSPSRDTAQLATEFAARLAGIDEQNEETERGNPASYVHTVRGGAPRGIDRGDPEAVWSAIAELKNGHVLRVGLADFAGALDPLDTCRELTAIAEVCLGQALAVVERQLAERHGTPRGNARLAVLGLGKLGGRELGYAADLDVVFVFASDDDAAESDGPVPLATVEWFSRCAQRLLGALRQRTPRGRLYEVDTRLRPSGSQGLLVASLAGWRRYHAEDARLWERQALTKLRPVAGDRALGDEVARLANETVYGAAPDVPAIAAGIAKMRDRIERELGGSLGRARAIDLKLGAGGVIEVEFAAQFLQLAYGHAHPALRTTSTSAALRAAAACGVAPAGDVDLLDQGYRFLRRIEHRLRVVHDQPIHRLPETKSELDKLARRSGFPDGAVLLEHVERWRYDVRAVYRRLLGA